MRTLLTVAGILLIGLVLVDVLKTTMAKGPGIITDRLGRWIWRLLARTGSGSQPNWVLVQGGLFILLVAVVVWITLLWTGWTLLFLGSEQAVVNAQTKLPATIADRIYFAGYTLFTLGLGDFQPMGTFWRIATSVAALSGLFVVTFSITYIVPVMEAAIERRHLAIYIHGLGKNTEDIILNMWDQEGCDVLEQHLVGLAPSISRLAQQHLTYPVLHYFHGGSREEAFAPNLAALDEALTVMEHGLNAECVAYAAYRPVRAALAELLKTLDSRFIDQAGEPPPIVRLKKLSSGGVPVTEEEIFRKAMEDVKERRQLLRALVLSEGWSWQDVRTEEDEGDLQDTAEQDGQAGSQDDTEDVQEEEARDAPN